MNDDKHQGIVLRWNERGFAFIQPDDGGLDVFAHISSVVDKTIGELSAGERVKYDLKEVRGRLQAANVEVI
jgi:CspA family cold shock protein